MFFDRDGNRWFVFTPMSLVCHPKFQLVNCSHVLSANSIVWGFHWKREYSCVFWFHHICFIWKPCIFHHFTKWVFIVCSNCSNIIGIMTSTYTRGRINQLTNCTRRFNASDTCGLWDSEFFLPTLCLF